MLMIFLMAILSLDLVSYSTQDAAAAAAAYTTTQHLSTRNGHGFPYYKTNSKRFNMTILSTLPTTTLPSSAANSTTTTHHTTHPTLRSTLTNITRVTTTRTKSTPSKQRKNFPPKHLSNLEKDLTPKSNMQVLQFYAHPLSGGIDLNVQPMQPVQPASYNYEPVPYSNPMTAVSHSQVYMAPPHYATPMPTLNPMHPYKTIPDEYVNSAELVPKALAFKPIQYAAAPTERTLRPMPVLDPYHLFKRNQKSGRPMPLQSPQQFIATVKPVNSPVSMLPPISVTRVYKYTEDTGLKLPFLSNDDSDDSLPVLSAALDDHLHDRVTNIGIRNYMTPPKLSQPIYYNAQTANLPPLGPGYRNEFHLINKFNDDLRAQVNPLAVRPQQHSYEQEEGEEGERTYSDEDVKKALKYIQHLKRAQSNKANRGRKKFHEDQSEDERPRKRKHKKPRKEEVEIEVEDFGEPEQAPETKKRKKKKKKEREYEFDEDEEFQANAYSEDDKNQEESRRKIVKAKKEDSLRSQESHIVPSVKEENTESDDFQESIDIGIENNDDGRVEFQMHGQGGPESYKFGYDTGKGESRQFRYEERDHEGKVKGHFGYYDRDGKLQVFNYEADPEHGYHLEKASEH